MQEQSVWCAIIGAGFAGASTAYHLTRRGAGDVLLVEQEAMPGVHSSGRNAAMIRQVVTDTHVAEMARRGAAHVRDPQKGWGEWRGHGGPTPFRACGSLLLGSGAVWDRLVVDAARAREAGVAAEPQSPQEVMKRLPVLQGAPFDGAIWTPDDGVVDVAALLQDYLSGARAGGAAVRYNCRVQAIRQVKGGRMVVETHQVKVQAEVEVNAAGAWAGEIGRRAGAAALPLRPCRRHLYTTGPLPWARADWPIVWDESVGVYFRPEAEGLLLSACDESEVSPGVPATDPDVEVLLAEKIAAFAPALPDLPIQRRWAGLRTLTPDGRFVIGWDAQVEGLFWVAGLGGHGVTCSYSVGETAAELLLGGRREAPNAHSPARFSTAS